MLKMFPMGGVELVVRTLEPDIPEATGIYPSFVVGHNTMVDILHLLADGSAVEHCRCIISHPAGVRSGWHCRNAPRWSRLLDPQCDDSNRIRGEKCAASGAEVLSAYREFCVGTTLLASRN